MGQAGKDSIRPVVEMQKAVGFSQVQTGRGRVTKPKQPIHSKAAETGNSQAQRSGKDCILSKPADYQWEAGEADQDVVLRWGREGGPSQRRLANGTTTSANMLL